MAATDEQRTAAVASESAIADRARDIRGDAAELTPALFLRLWPLLLEPIPEGLIETVGVVKGKPYASTGVSSVQVQIDRMNNVLTPMWWEDEVTYNESGTVAHVQIRVLGVDRQPIIVRQASGGVNQGSTTGNIYKGSYTNAAKLAFARVGPGHEVYLGVTDLDPDVDEKIAAEQVQTGAPTASDKLLNDEQRERVLAEIKASGHDTAALLSRVGVEDAANLTIAHAFALRELLDQGKLLTEEQRAGLVAHFGEQGVPIDLFLTAVGVDSVDQVT